MLESLLRRDTRRVQARSLATLYEESERIIRLLVPPIELSRAATPAVENAERRGISAEDLAADGSLNRLEGARNQQDRRRPQTTLRTRTA